VTAPLDVSDLVVRRGDRRVLRGASLRADAGEVVGLVGPNGAGKTTLLRACTGAVTPESGTVRLSGDDAAGLSARETARLAASVPQDPSLDFDFPVREAVAMGRTAHVPRFGRRGSADRAAVERAMARAAVSELADRSVTAISGGERARVLLARALAQEAPLLLLDEPTANLDVNHQVRTLSLVRDLTDEGRAVVAAIHDLDLAARFCDRLVLLADGRIRAAGRPEAVLTPAALADAFGVNARVSRDPATGSLRVTVLGDSTAERAVEGDVDRPPDSAESAPTPRTDGRGSG
jgi:iron complex transport system ATP-binding protein